MYFIAVGNWEDCIGGQPKRQLSPASDDQNSSTSPRGHINNSQVPYKDALISPVQQIQPSRVHHGIDHAHPSSVAHQHLGPKVIVSTEPWWKRSSASSSSDSGKWFFHFSSSFYFLHPLFPLSGCNLSILLLFIS